MATDKPMDDPAFPDRRMTEPEALRVRSLTPSMTVDDLDRSLRFYTTGLGFTVEERWEDDGNLTGVMLVAGNCRIGLSQDDWKQGRDRPKGVAFRIWAETVQDLDGLAERLAERGIEYDGPKDEPWGARTLSVVDPDGFKLTFSPPQGD